MLLMTKSLRLRIWTHPYRIFDPAHIGAQPGAQLLPQTIALPPYDLTLYAVRLLFCESIPL
jgi:hypothetical protein